MDWTGLAIVFVFESVAIMVLFMSDDEKAKFGIVVLQIIFLLYILAV